ncbi:HNH endonuclease [Gilliamella sp. Pas-s25]|uniref:HNH endonuclease n=1 Tax=Gilliamella sp. Pas-s25 TaxID=2687310 RepID=UPI00135E38E7|nr:HNH endonuclease [Gilliamella sp. Pas-s25]MWP63318.1 hypothetical protein [Gilliamella sp. Pas-s25]
MFAKLISRKELSNFLLFYANLKIQYCGITGNRLTFFSDKHFDYNRFGNLIVENAENRMQLVPSKQHLKTGHIGGEALSKGK